MAYNQNLYSTPEREIILFDGNCGLCRRTIDWIKKRDLNSQFDMVAFQEVPSPPMTHQLYEACQKAMHIIKTNGEIIRGGKAFLFVLERMNWFYGLPFILKKKPFIWFIELGYYIVATNRNFFSQFIFTRNEQGNIEKFCKLPSENQIK